MKRVYKGCAWLCFIAMLMGCVATASGEAMMTSALIITYHPEDAPALPFAVVLKLEENEKWLWLELTEDIPLASLELSFFPASEGSILLEQSDAYYAAYPPEEPLEEGEKPLLDLAALDFTLSAEYPYHFTIFGNTEEAPILWTGWLTVSSETKPEDLPEVPLFVEPTPEPTEEPTPEPTEEPTPEPTEEPTPEPTEEPTPEPTEEPTPEPTEKPTKEPTQAPTEKPTREPTQPPTPKPVETATPTLLPTISPSPKPTNTPSPISQTGYAIVTSNAVNLRESPNGQVVGRVNYRDVLYITGQRYDTDGMPWHMVTVMGSGMSGYIHSDYTRFMTSQEVQEYLNRPTPIPTTKPTEVPLPTSELVSGYARVIWQTATFRSGPYSTAERVKTLYTGDVVYVIGMSVDASGTRWYSARSDTTYGYLLSSSVVMMTSSEVSEYLASIRNTAAPTVAPTTQPTLNPEHSYAVVRINNVNFRIAPNGGMISRVHAGVYVRLLSAPVQQDGYDWYRVQIDDDIGYIRADMLDLIEIKPSVAPTQTIFIPTASPSPTPSPVPTATPTMAPSPTPMPLPSAEPMGVLDRIRAMVDEARYTEFARTQEKAVSYAVRDFNSDRLVELMTVTHEMRDGSHLLVLDGFKFEGGEIRLIASREISPVLEAGTEMQVVLVQQDGRDIVYVAQRDTILSKTISGEAMTLVGDEWTSVILSKDVENPIAVLLASANMVGGYELDDRSGLHSIPEETEGDEQESVAYAAITEIIIKLLEGLLQGNG